MIIRTWLVVLFTVILMTLSNIGSCTGSDTLKREDFPVVLMYHDIKVKEINGFDVSVDSFKKQLDWLNSHGYKTLSVDEVVDYLTQNKPFPEKSLLITFDDGYEGVFTYAAPELHKRGMKAAFYIIRDDIGTKLPGYPYLTGQEIKELSSDPLFSIQSHTLTHPDLTKITAEQLQKELEESKKYLEDFTGKPIQTFAYPYGFYNDTVLEAVEHAGYQASFSVSDLGLDNHSARFSIPRIYMGVVMGKQDMKLFKFSVQNYKTMPKEAFVERFGPLTN